MSSLYWDDFERRIKETLLAIESSKAPTVRRVSVFITNKCNFRCTYCNMKFNNHTMKEKVFDNIIQQYGKTALIHITGGEPSLVPWLYQYIDCHKNYRFHLNSNCYIKPPRNIKRLKVSLDSYNEKYFNQLVKHKNAFKKVIENIEYASSYTITSITCVLNAETYKETPEFMRFCRKTFPKLYAVFFSVYKGNNPKFKFTKEQANEFFNIVKPKLEKEMDNESYRLLNETIDEKRRIMEGIRFPENKLGNKCYLSLSERVFDWQGNMYKCSHLFRDKILDNTSIINNKCKYGCNRRLIKFNEQVENRLKKRIKVV